MNWKDITTAPKDGMAVLLADGEEVHVSYYIGDWFCYHHSTTQGTALSGVAETPTHWMELPKLPSGEVAENSKPVQVGEETIEIYEVK